jgi:hypothetical protein
VPAHKSVHKAGAATNPNAPDGAVRGRNGAPAAGPSPRLRHALRAGGVAGQGGLSGRLTRKCSSTARAPPAGRGGRCGAAWKARRRRACRRVPPRTTHAVRRMKPDSAPRDIGAQPPAPIPYGVAAPVAVITAGPPGVSSPRTAPSSRRPNHDPECPVRIVGCPRRHRRGPSPSPGHCRPRARRGQRRRRRRQGHSVQPARCRCRRGGLRPGRRRRFAIRASRAWLRANGEAWCVRHVKP